jgi:HEAT repeat protein
MARSEEIAAGDGRLPGASARSTDLADSQEVSSKIVPAFLSVLDQPDSVEIESAVLMALCKSGVRLVQSLERDSRGRPWAALGLALCERGVATSAGATPLLVREALQKERNPSDLGALAVAAGLMSDSAATHAILEKFEGIEEDRARGHLAIALGLLGSRESADVLQRAASDGIYQPRFVREAALALALLQDAKAPVRWVQILQESDSQLAQASLAQALGRVGDARAIDPLVRLLSDRDRSPSLRAYAAAALGGIADARPLPWNTCYSLDLNWRAAPPTLLDPSGFGVLNIL